MSNKTLPQSMAQLVRDWPASSVRQLAAQLKAGQSLNYIERNLSSPMARQKFRELRLFLEAEIAVTPQAVALALLTALEADDNARSSAAELVWTGPLPSHIGMRRTDAALLEVIQSARKSLWLVTFAVHGGHILKNALAQAAASGVEIHFIAETKASGKIWGDNSANVRSILPPSAHLYEWPVDSRGRNEKDEHGTLHAKIAVADHHLALLSSANLTDCALDFNIESGVLLRGSEAARIAQQLEDLVAQGIWQKVEDTNPPKEKSHG